MYNKRKKILLIIFLSGVLLMLYPKISNVISNYYEKKLIDKHMKTLDYISDEKIQKMYKDATKYNEEIYMYQKYNRTFNSNISYDDVLKIDYNGIMGFIEIPAVNIKLPIYHGISDNVLQKGVGHVEGTSLPIGSNSQHSFLMGHSGLSSAKLFTDLDKLNIGDYFKISVLNNDIYYNIINIEKIKPEKLINKMTIVDGKDLISLVTCVPYGVNSHRLVLTAERSMSSDKVENYKKELRNVNYKTNYACYLVSFIVLIILFFFAKKKGGKNDEPKD